MVAAIAEQLGASCRCTSSTSRSRVARCIRGREDVGAAPAGGRRSTPTTTTTTATTTITSAHVKTRYFRCCFLGILETHRNLWSHKSVSADGVGLCLQVRPLVSPGEHLTCVTLRLRRPRAVRVVRRSAVNNVWSCWWCSTERWCSTSTHSVSSGVSRHRVSSVCECAAREQCAQPPPCCSTANAGHTEYSYGFPSVAGAAARDVTALFPHNKTWRRAANQRARGHNGRPIGRRLPPRRPTIVRITMEPTTTGAGPQCRHPQLVRRSRYSSQRKLPAVPLAPRQEKATHRGILWSRIGKAGRRRVLSPHLTNVYFSVEMAVVRRRASGAPASRAAIGSPHTSSSPSPPSSTTASSSFSLALPPLVLTALLTEYSPPRASPPRPPPPHGRTLCEAGGNSLNLCIDFPAQWEVRARGRLLLREERPEALA
ncbi:hypothetical protein E2C01_046355 [Portunus trituberculatus]|uniref:Uncharacterized protein n=1 Tax=Portunus trituberculatus TaxID=210409 RepID=A0A5B7G4Z5_PORTR|nr:hypothetical protein [Portunus trituberculatus]